MVLIITIGAKMEDLLIYIMKCERIYSTHSLLAYLFILRWTWMAGVGDSDDEISGFLFYFHF